MAGIVIAFLIGLAAGAVLMLVGGLLYVVHVATDEMDEFKGEDHV